MTTKTPSGLAAGSAGSDDETIDDSLDEILLHANEKPLDSQLRSQLPKLQLPRPTNTATLLGLPATSLPLPGALPVEPEEPEASEAFSPEITPAVMPRSDDVTQIARSSLLDEPIEEETKVEPLETARRAAASVDEVEVALTEQASAEREKALRKSFPPAPRMSDTDSGAEFEDPEDQRATDTSDTPASIPVGEDDDESTANGRGPLSGSGGGGLPAPVSLGSTRLPPLGNPLGRSEPFSARLPTPGAGFGVPAPSPAFGVPSSSPPLGISSYGSPAPVIGYGGPAGASAYGGTRASSPAVPIPAPIGAPASVRRSLLFAKVQLPVGGLVAFLIAFFSLGLVVGAWRWRGEEAEIPVVVAPPPAAPIIQPAATAPVVQPVPSPPPSAPAAEAEAAPAVVAVPAPAPVAVEPTPIPAATPTAPKPARPARRPPADSAQPSIQTASSTTSTASGSAAIAKPNRPKSKPTTPGSKPGVDARGVAKGWVDPFAQ